MGLVSMISRTFGVKTLMSSLRKRNLAASLWNRFPQLFIHASRTWKAPNQSKSQPTETFLTFENEREEVLCSDTTKKKREKNRSDTAWLWLTTFKCHTTWGTWFSRSFSKLHFIVKHTSSVYVWTTNRVVSQKIQIQIKILMSLQPCDDS